tara:strand:- start:319 stop:564 length:246 start_codon:yes stop_codon:yes gene_type:complete
LVLVVQVARILLALKLAQMVQIQSLVRLHLLVVAVVVLWNHRVLQEKLAEVVVEVHGVLIMLVVLERLIKDSQVVRATVLL